MLDVSVVEVDELEGAGSGSLFYVLPTAVYVFGAACASVVGGCASFIFILCIFLMACAKSFIPVLIPVIRS